MAIYDFKEFLDIDDIKDYLTDKNVGCFRANPIMYESEQRLFKLISEWIKLGKLQVLYPFDKWVIQYKIDYGFDITKANVSEFADNILHDFIATQKGEPKKHNYKATKNIIGEKFINDYLVLGVSIWESLCNFDSVELGVLDWYKFYNDENNKYQWEIVYSDDIPQEHRNFIIRKDKVLFKTSQLDTIINQPNPTEQLQAKDDIIAEQAKLIAELQANQGAGAGDKPLHPRTANNASKIILAMSELLKWDLSKPYAQDTNGKIIEVLEKQGNNLSKDIVGNWLKQAHDIGK